MNERNITLCLGNEDEVVQDFENTFSFLLIHLHKQTHTSRNKLMSIHSVNTGLT